MTRRLSSSVFAGRESELGELVAAMTRAADGAPAVVLVGGEAGIGKSRLLSEFATRAADGGARVLWGQCVGLEEAAIPLLPVADALSDLADDGGDAARDLLAAVAAPLAGPASAQLVAGPVARLHALVLDRLERASASAPVVLVLEDLQWADRSTLDLVAFVARRLRRDRILVVASYRTNEADRRDHLRRFLADLGTAPIAQRLELAGLTRAEMHCQVAEILGATPPAELFQAVFGRSEGNPFFAEELLAVATRSSADGLSPTLRDMLLARIAALDAGAQAVVRVAAAGGREVHHRLLATAAGLPEPELSAALRAAVRDHVLMARDDGFAFRHALLQEVAYGELLPGERARLHAAFAAALEARTDVAGGNAATVAAEIAHHWLRAGDKPRALTAAVRAGTEAERVGALAEAARHHRRALALWDVVPDADRPAGIDRATLLARAANAPAWTGHPAEAIDLVDAAIALVDPAAEPVRAALLHQRRGIYLWQLGHSADGVRDFEHAVWLIPAEPPSAERARALGGLGLILMLAGQPARSRGHCEAAVAIARDVGARVEEADALASLGDDICRLGDRAAGLEHLRRARSIAMDTGDREVLSRTAVPYSDMLRRDGQLAEAVEVALAGARESRRAGLDLREGFCEMNAAEAAYELGRWDLVDRLTRDVLARGVTGVTLAFVHYIAGTLACARGDLDAAAAHLGAQHDAVGPDPLPPDYYVIETEAELALWQGRPEAASRVARHGVQLAAQDALRCVLMASLGLRAEADRAELARARRDRAAEDAARRSARAFLDTARERAGDADHPALAATIEAEHTRAEGHSDPATWDAAARAWEPRPAPYQAAYARWRQAEAALARRDRAQGAQALRASHVTAASLGAALLRSELEALARRARIELSAREPAVAEEALSGNAAAAAELGLTAREREVLEHLALGQTNRQIADELFISIKTAGVHVSNILGKLGAANRGEAAAVAHRLGLVPREPGPSSRFAEPLRPGLSPPPT
jgi:DNA-binding CsgD family transcriptional regulator/tetratricopeptide (TPR) repeat protein